MLALKAAFKASTGLDWSPAVVIPSLGPKPETKAMSNPLEIDGKIKECGDRVRNLKAEKADKVSHLDFIEVIIYCKALFLGFN